MREVTRRTRESRQSTTTRILTGGEIGQARERAFAKVFGQPDPTKQPPERPMRTTADMATQAEVDRRVRRDFRGLG